MGEENKFCIVVPGNRLPAKIHQTYDAAVEEAKRLILSQQHLLIYVAQVIAKVEPIEVKVTLL